MNRLSGAMISSSTREQVPIGLPGGSGTLFVTWCLNQDEAVLNAGHDGFGAIFRAELAHDGRNVELCSVLGNVEARSDFLVAEPESHEPKDFNFARCKSFGKVFTVLR